MIVRCVCTRVCHTEEHEDWSPVVPCACASCTQSQPLALGAGRVLWAGVSCSPRCPGRCTAVRRGRTVMTLPKKALGVLLHSSPATDRSTQVGKEEVEGNAKWKPNATALH